MIANAAVMMLLMNQERRNGWEPDPNGWGAFDALIVLFFTVVIAFAILWVLS